MERKGKREGLLERTVQAFDIPGEVAGLVRVELTGRHEVRMSNHRGILAYGPREILVSGGKLMVRIKGEGLTLGAMNASELLITGTILSVELE